MGKRILSAIILVCMTLTSLNFNVVYAYDAAKPLPTLTGNQADDLVRVANSQKGYSGYGRDDTVYGATYGKNGYDWCTSFVIWCADKAGVSSNIIPHEFMADSMEFWFRNRGLWKTSNPQHGDLIFFDRNNTNDAEHVGIVDYVANSRVYIIEGNTSSDVVAYNDYSLSDGGILGYASPQYKAITKPTEAWIQLPKGDESRYAINEEVRITFGANNATSYYIEMYKEDKYYYSNTFSTGICYASFAQPGHYSCFVEAINSAGKVATRWVGWDIGDIPTNVKFSIDKGYGGTYKTGETVAMSFSATNAKNYWVGIHNKSDYSLYDEFDAGATTKYNYVFTKPGEYLINVSANNSVGSRYSEKQLVIVKQAYKITATSQNNNRGTVSGTDNYYANTQATLTATPKNGYYFSNWSNGSTSNPYKVTVTGTANYSAKFLPNTYTIKYNGNGATGGSTANSTHTYDTAKALTANGFTRTGYTFKGWATSASGNVVYTNGQSVKNLTATNGATINLYAVWQKNGYTLYVRPHGGTWNGSTSNQSYSLTYQETKSIPVPTKTGYTFGAWALDFSGSGHKITGSGSTGLLQVRGTPLFADPVFNSSNGSMCVYNNSSNGTVTHKRIAKDSSFEMSSSYMMQITTSGKASPGLGGFYQSTASKAAGVFYHVIAAKIPVGYYIQRASNSCGDNAKHEWLTPQAGTGKWETYIYKTQCGSSGSFSTLGHVFISSKSTWDASSETASTPVTWYVGYAEMFDATGVSSSGSTYTMGSGNGYLHALWVPNTYTVTYNANGGSGTMSNSTHIYDTAKALTANTFSRTGYTFKGWATSASGNVVYTNGQSVKNLTATANGTVPLYAVWNANSYPVTLNPNGGNVSPAQLNVTYASAYGSLPTPTREDYAFLGWYTAIDGGTQITNNTKVTITKAQTLYAHWERLDYTISYELNGGSGSIEASVYPSETVGTITNIVPTREGYRFLGWATDSQSAIANYLPGSEYTANESVTLYAVWKLIPYTQTTITKKNSYSTFAIEVFHAEEPCTVLIALYKNGKLVECQQEAYTDTPLFFASFVEYDTIKVMLWSDTDTMTPLCDAEWYTTRSYTDSKVIKSENTYTVNTALYNITDSCEVVAVGCRNQKFVSLQTVPSAGEVVSTSLSGDIDTIKIMVWDNLNGLKPLCEAEVIPSSRFITE